MVLPLNNHKATSAFIEISGKCQASCPYCLRNRFNSDRYNGQMMTASLFEKILTHLFNQGFLDKKKHYRLPLYNWGEPLLNPQLNEILLVLKKMGQYADLSSNFIKKSSIDDSLLSVIKTITVSLSGFSQESYGKIHSASLKNVLENFEDLYGQVRRDATMKTKFFISWHRYTFNEKEFWDAYKFFNRPRITFIPVVAYLNDLSEMYRFVNNQLTIERKKSIIQNILQEDILRMINFHRKRSERYRCPAWDFLVIDETGQLLLCCGFSRYDKDYVLGNFFEMSNQEIWNRKLNHPFCKNCVSSGLARYAYNQGIQTPINKPWPPGGGLNYFNLWRSHNLSLSRLNGILHKFPYVSNLIKKFR